MQRRWRRQWKRTVSKFILTSLAAATLSFSVYSTGYANPSGGTVTTGAGVITQNGNNMIITQTTDKMGINWQNFSIGAGEKTQFIQPGTNSVVLNRVIGSNPTTIYGTLSANGKVFLINPNGVLFAPGAQVNVGGLLASTLNIADSDFNAGNYSFRGSGGSVINNGTINAANGYVALLGSEVKNQGVIAAKQGTVALGAGSRITLDMNGDGLLNLAVDQAAMNTSVTNHNLIQADGGTVIMTTGAKDALLKTVVSNSGIIQAKSVSNQNGIIRLEGGTVTNSGTLDASGNVTGQTGGTVKVLGETVLLTDNAKLNASGDKGGGTILIGGNYQGKVTEENATNTTVGQNVTINADAITRGNGGKVVVWANDTTNYYGNISAKGGANSGDGGNVEVSGKKTLLYRGLTNLTANKGITGNMLLDPGEYIISTSATSGNVYNTTDLANQLNSANMTLQTDSSGIGDITIANDVTWTSGKSLTLTAFHNINVNAAINAGRNADVTLDAGHSVELGSSGIIITNNGNVNVKNHSETAASGIFDTDSTYLKMADNSKIYTQGGNVIIRSGILGGSQDGYVQIGNSGSGAVIDAGGGDITITGVTANGTDKGIVVGINSLLQSTGNGSIILNGVGKIGGNYSGGVIVCGVVQTMNGDITITGESRGTLDNNYGVEVTAGLIKSTGNGKVVLDGIGGPGTDANFGICVNNSGRVQVKDGSLIINGTSKGTGVGNHGVMLRIGANIESIGNAIVKITGIGGKGTHDNFGMQIDNSRIASVEGDVTLDVIGGQGSTGTNVGLVTTGSSTIESSGTAQININGTGGNGTSDNSGIWIASGTVKTVDGDIELNGAGGNGTASNNDGIVLGSSAIIQSSGKGKINLIGKGGIGTSSNEGISIGGVISSQQSNVYLNGTGGTATSTGIQMDVGTTIQAGGNATLVASGGNFINNGGANAVSTTSGKRWLIYSSSPAGNVTGGLELDHDFSLYNTAYASGVTPSYSGNGFIYASPLNLSATLTGTVTKIYDGTPSAALTAANFQLSGLSGATGTGGSVSGTYDNKNVGSGKTVTINGTATLSGVNDLIGKAVYGYNFDGTLNGTISGDITQAPLTAALTGTVKKTYDGTTAATLSSSSYSLNGVIGSDAVTLVTAANGNYGDKNVGSGKNVTVNGLSLSGSDAGNYTIGTSVNGNVGVIDQAPLTAVLTGTVKKTYDGTTTATLNSGNYSLNGVIGNDAVALVTATNGTYGDKNAGSGKNVTVNGLSLSGDDAGNYTIGTSVNGNVGVIDQASLTAVLTGTVKKTYDGKTTATLNSSNYSLNGVVTGDSVNVANTQGSYNDKNAGSGKNVAVDGITLSGGDAGNYTIGASVNGNVGVIDQAPLTAVLTGTVKKTYDGKTTATLNSSNYSLNGVVIGDSVNVANTQGSYNDKNAGSGKNVTADGITLSGGDADNYTVASSVSGNVGVIDKATLTVTATANTKVYDGTTGVSGIPKVSGLQTGDTVTNLSEVYTDQAVGINKTLTVSGYTLSDGNGGNNYIVTTVDNNSGVITAIPTQVPTEPQSDHYNGAIVTANDSHTDDASMNPVSHSINVKSYVVPKQGIDLTVVLPKADIVVPNGRQIDVTVPRDTLPLTDETMQLTALQSNGQPLPSWLSFDPQAVRFYGQPPTGFSGTIHVRITMRDTRGNETSAVFKLIIGTAANDQGTLQAETVGDSTKECLF
ncbi:filamentous hemagglutinin family protein [Sporomusaceae bacterium BoRhaA]|uniref:YDG domain-containing protein n=1 Tax=Pelorhabdus rhamnosifermentans TaxID=2772457 RepID=UPI001C0605C3|nr:YDG domain-containing protein [Pelorhabdus rhamnosifermentans]MBU2702175.1 filamentous hemagglutinin family protein [Pelorhabdus rhamnosifermentans]